MVVFNGGGFFFWCRGSLELGDQDLARCCVATYGGGGLRTLRNMLQDTGTTLDTKPDTKLGT